MPATYSQESVTQLKSQGRTDVGNVWTFAHCPAHISPNTESPQAGNIEVQACESVPSWVWLLAHPAHELSALTDSSSQPQVWGPSPLAYGFSIHAVYPVGWEIGNLYPYSWCWVTTPSTKANDDRMMVSYSPTTSEGPQVPHPCTRLWVWSGFHLVVLLQEATSVTQLSSRDEYMVWRHLTQTASASAF